MTSQHKSKEKTRCVSDISHKPGKSFRQIINWTTYCFFFQRNKHYTLSDSFFAGALDLPRGYFLKVVKDT